MMKITTFLLMAAAIIVSQTSSARDTCEYEREINRIAEIKDVDEIFVNAGAGKLFVQGSPDREDILIQAKLCASKESVFKEMKVTASQNDDTAFVKTHIPDGGLVVGVYYAQIDLNVIVPANTKLSVSDSSGAAQIGNVSELDMVDSSGALVITDVENNVKVKDSSGKLVLRDIGGEVQIVDSSGSIEADNIGQDVVVIQDSSGGIRLKNIGGNVLVKRDSSGAIQVDTVGGDFSVLKDSSGGITYKNVEGEINIPDN